MKHEAAPKPRLTDADYRKDYLSDKIGVQKRLECFQVILIQFILMQLLHQ